jgi:hypothetical protein
VKGKYGVVSGREELCKLPAYESFLTVSDWRGKALGVKLVAPWWPLGQHLSGVDIIEHRDDMERRRRIAER